MVFKAEAKAHEQTGLAFSQSMAILQELVLSDRRRLRSLMMNTGNHANNEVI